MHYDFIAIPDADLPQAVEPLGETEDHPMPVSQK